MKFNFTVLSIILLTASSAVRADEQQRPMEIENASVAATSGLSQTSSRKLQEKNGCQICHETGDCSNAMNNGPGFACPITGIFQVCCPPEHTCDGGLMCKSPPTECEKCGESGQCDKAYFGNPGIFCNQSGFLVKCCGKGDICGTIDCKITKDSEFFDDTQPPQSTPEPTEPEPTTTTSKPIWTTKSPTKSPSDTDLDIDEPALELGSFNFDRINDNTPTPNGGIGQSVSPTIAIDAMCIVLFAVSTLQLIL